WALALAARPTRARRRCTRGRIVSRRAPVTSSANATFASAVRSGRRRKSWNTTPSRRRSFGMSPRRRRAEEKPETRTSPVVGRSAIRISLRIVDFPAPEWPVRKTNSPLRTWRETSRRAAPERGYSLETDCSLITRVGRLRGTWNASPNLFPGPGRVKAPREAGGEVDGLDHRPRVGDPAAGDVERGPVVGGGAGEGKAQGDVDPASEGDRLEGRHP